MKRQLVCVAVTAMLMTPASPAVAGGGNSPINCPECDVFGSAGDDELVVYDDRVEFYRSQQLLRVEQLVPRSNVLIDTMTGNDVIVLRTSQRSVVLFTGTGDDEVSTGTSNATVTAFGNLEAVAGTASRPVTFGVAGDADIRSTGGVVATVHGDATIRSGDQDDDITVLGEADIETGGGDDVVWTGGHDDEIDTGPGDDSVHSGGGDDRVDTGPGDDIIDSGLGGDRVDGGPGIDQCDHGTGNSRSSQDRYENCEIAQIDPTQLRHDLGNPFPGPVLH